MIIFVGFSKKKSGILLFSKLIQWFLNRNFSHVYYMINDNGIEFVFESNGHGTFIRSINDFIGRNIVLSYYKLPELSPENQINFKNNLINMSGIKYGTMQNAGVFLVDVWNMISPDFLTVKKNPFTSGQNCSETLAILLNKYWGVEFSEEFNLVDPADVERVLVPWLRSQ